MIGNLGITIGRLGVFECVEGPSPTNANLVGHGITVHQSKQTFSSGLIASDQTLAQ